MDAMVEEESLLLAERAKRRLSGCTSLETVSAFKSRAPVMRRV